MTGFSEATLRKLWPHGDSKIPGLIAGIAAAQTRVYAKYGITSDLVVAQMMAQFSHECGAGTEMVENTNYSAARAAVVWPLRGDNDKYAYRHFRDAADCYRKCDSSQTDPEFHKKLINLVYGDRNGNRKGTDDGWDFIGRGLPQLTGRANYDKSFKDTGVDVVNHPELASSPEDALEIGVADFIACGCMPFAEKDDIVNVTQHLNGGQTGIDERRQWLDKWKRALAGEPDPPKMRPEHAAATAAIAATGGAALTASHAGASDYTIMAVLGGGVVLAGLIGWLLKRKT